MQTLINPATLIMSLRGLSVWDVTIRNNYYNGRYPTYSGRCYPVIATSAEEATQVVLHHADAILKDLKSKRFHNGRLILPTKTAVPITKTHVVTRGKSTNTSKLSTHNFISLFSLDGVCIVKLNNGNIIDVQK